MGRGFGASIIFAILLAGANSAAFGQLSLNNLAPITIDFDHTVAGVNVGRYTGIGFAPATTTTGQLDSNAWASTGMSDGDSTFGGTYTTGHFAKGVTLGSTSGFYGFADVGATGNSIFGIKTTSTDFTPGTVTLKVKNNTGAAMTQFGLSYVGWSRNSSDNSNTLDAGYSTNGTTFVDMSLRLTSATTHSTTPVFESTSFSKRVTGVNIASGAFFYIRFSSDDVEQTASGVRDEQGFDNIMLQAPEPSTGIATLLLLIGLSQRRKQRLRDIIGASSRDYAGRSICHTHGPAFR